VGDLDLEDRDSQQSRPFTGVSVCSLR
jgi:hypothetical protein